MEVNLGALKMNAMMLARSAGVPLLPMVKSDAYGLGVAQVVGALESLTPWGYGVATVDEGAELRSLGVKRPILVFTPVLAQDYADIRAHGLTPTFGDEARIRAWQSSGGGDWHLAIDTGMSRAGAPWRIATVSAGDADGVRRSLSNRGVALVNGVRAAIAGVVTMDMTMLDVTGIDCQIGDVATFLGRQGNEELLIADVAASGGLSPYELLVGLRLRANRVYVDS